MVFCFEWFSTNRVKHLIFEDGLTEKIDFCFTTCFLARKGLRKALHKPAQIQVVAQVKKIHNLCNGKNNLKQEK
jgi:hypothetical protein